MSADLVGATHIQHEDPTGDAASAGAAHLSVGVAAAQVIASRLAARAAARAQEATSAGTGKDKAGAADEDTAGAAGRALSPFEKAKAAYAPMMAKDRGHTASAEVALAAWEAAMPWRQDYREAAKAATRAENRLREIHPEAMERFDRLRVGMGDLAAATRVAPTIPATAAGPSAQRSAPGPEPTRASAPRLSPFEAARAAYAPMLAADRGHTASAQVALSAWESASQWSTVDREAAKATTRAENRLRELHPATMARYDQLRAGLGDLAAATQVAATISGPGQGDPLRPDAPAEHKPSSSTTSSAQPSRPGRESADTVQVWLTALATRSGDRHAVAAAAATAKDAEGSLRKSHPDALARYDALRKGLDPVAAMREVAPLIRHEINHPNARATFTQMLRPDAAKATTEVALAALVAAAPMREHASDAASAATRAEERLRALHPQVMRDYDSVRTQASAPDAVIFAADQLGAQRRAATGPATTGPTQPSPTTSAPTTSAPTTSAPAAGVGAASGGGAREPLDPSLVATYERVARTALPEQIAGKVLADPSWPALAQSMHAVTTSGRDAGGALTAALAEREMASAKHPAQVLSHRLDAQAATAAAGDATAPAPAQAVAGAPGRAAHAAATSYPRVPSTSPDRPGATSRTTSSSLPAHVATRSYPAPPTSAPAPAASATAATAPAARQATAISTPPAGQRR